MAFFTSAVSVLQTLVIAIGAGLGIWGVVNLLEGYGNDNPGAKSQGIKHNMARKMQTLQRIFLNLRLKIAERISTVQATLNLMATVARPIGCRH